ncbi:MAG: hypothetical protein ACD_34C00576G0002 [uncultured bacterium]|nr:MAG: hypothetical protein ACD_34C00576G0002 [uncultured bacterium]
MLNKVVLPAPLGPIIECRLFSRIEILTSSTATNPPNSLRKFLASRSGFCSDSIWLSFIYNNFVGKDISILTYASYY